MKLLRWLAWVPVPMILFALSMNIAHIGSEWLLAAVALAAAVAAALIYFLRREPQDAGRRLHP
jgi:predicted permease